MKRGSSRCWLPVPKGGGFVRESIADERIVRERLANVLDGDEMTRPMSCHVDLAHPPASEQITHLVPIVHETSLRTRRTKLGASRIAELPRLEPSEPRVI